MIKSNFNDSNEWEFLWHWYIYFLYTFLFVRYNFIFWIVCLLTPTGLYKKTNIVFAVKHEYISYFKNPKHENLLWNSESHCVVNTHCKIWNTECTFVICIKHIMEIFYIFIFILSNGSKDRGCLSLTISWMYVLTNIRNKKHSKFWIIVNDKFVICL